MRLSGGGDVHHVRPDVPEHLLRIREDVPDMKAIGQLRGHQLLGIAGRDDFAARQGLELGDVLIRDKSASDDRNLGQRPLIHFSETRSSESTHPP